MQRRHFLKAGGAGLALSLASGFSPKLASTVWAKAGGVTLLTAANNEENDTFLVGLSDQADIRFSLPLPGRGHAAATHPHRAEAVAFARRPGTFAMVIDCKSGDLIAQLPASEGRHFYGHGAFTQDGRYLLTTENAYDTPAGKIGVWDAADGYKRIGEFASGGIGPHEIIRLSGDVFAIANGGIQTHPDFARSKLNLHKMRPNLTLVDQHGAMIDQVEPPSDLYRNSIRHIAADSEDRIFIALQWQGSPLAKVPLAASWKKGEALRFHDHPDMVRLKQFGGSIAVSGDEKEFVVTSPRGGHALFFDRATGNPINSHKLDEVSGAVRFGQGLALTVKGGLMIGSSQALKSRSVEQGLTWDNHLVSL